MKGLNFLPARGKQICLSAIVIVTCEPTLPWIAGGCPERLARQRATPELFPTHRSHGSPFPTILPFSISRKRTTFYENKISKKKQKILKKITNNDKSIILRFPAPRQPDRVSALMMTDAQTPFFGRPLVLLKLVTPVCGLQERTWVLLVDARKSLSLTLPTPRLAL